MASDAIESTHFSNAATRFFLAAAHVIHSISSRVYCNTKLAHINIAALNLAFIIMPNLTPLSAEAQTVPSIPITTPATVPATYTIGPCPAGQVIIPPGLYASGECGIENYWPGSYLNVSIPPVTPACPVGYRLSSFNALYTPPNSALHFEGWCTLTNPLTCPSNSQPTTVPIGATCTCDTGYRPDAAGTSCIQYNLTITLEIGSEVEPLKNLTLKAVVKGADGPKGGIPVTLILDVQPTSGGHVHGESNAAVRPRGSLTGAITCPSTAPPRSVCAAGVTSSQAPYIGEAWFTFTAPAVAGTHTLSATCTDCTNTASASVNVKVPNLASLTTAPSDYVLVGGGTGKKHIDNHWLTATATKNLKAIVREYNTAYPAGPLLRLNDASLEWGGKFDIAGSWGGEHAEHRGGVVIDIRANQDVTAIPEARFKDFQTFASQSGGAFADLHCNPPYSLTCPGCILDTGSNRHYHVRLLGKNVGY